MPMWQLFDRIRAYLRKANVYRQENLYQDQTDISRITSGANFLELTRASGLLDQTNLQINRLERYKDYDMMDEVGEISLSLDIYSDEATLADSDRGHSLIVKSSSKKIKQELEDLYYNTLLTDRELRPIIRYLCKYGDFPAEVVPTKNRDGVASLRFINVYNFTRVQTKYGDLVGFFYQDPNTMQPIFLHPWQVMHLRLTSLESAYWPYGRCCNLNSRIWTPNGSKELKDLQKGDEVYSFDLKTQKPVITKVLNKVINGKKKVLNIKTKHRSIKVTPEHPMLAIIKNKKVLVKATNRNCAHLQNHIVRDVKTKQYILAKDLKIGDKLVLPKLYDEGVDIPIKQYKISKHYGKKMKFPDKVDINFAKLMGFLIGNGWVPKSNHSELCFAEGEYPEINQKYIDIIKSYGYEKYPCRIVDNDRKYGYFIFGSLELSQTMVQMGLVGRCYEKRVPQWVFTAKEEIKKAFIEGLVDSDSSVNIDRWNCVRYQLEVTSEELVKDLKILLDQMNIKCGNIGKRNRLSPIVVFYDKEYIRHDSWIVYWYDSKMPSGDLLHRGRKLAKYDYSSDDYLVESIRSIEDAGEEEVGDIQVSEHHNFIADGVVIHNSVIDGSRRDFKRLRLMEDAALVYRLSRSAEKRIFNIPVGNIPPNQVYHYITEIARGFKKTKFVDPASGQVNERYNPLIQDDDFFLPKRPGGEGPSIETLPGAANLDQIEDILYFKKKMVAGTKIPFSRVGIGEASDNDTRSVASVSPEFAKSVQWVQREALIGFKKIGIIHLALKGYSLSEIKDFDLSMTAASAIDELYRIETWSTRADIIKGLQETELFPDEWILQRFTDMTMDEIKQMQVLKKESVKEEEKLSPPSDIPELPIGEEMDDKESKLLLEFDSFLKRNPIDFNKVGSSNPNIDWYINQNELDNLKHKGELIESKLDKKLIEETKNNHKLLLLGGVSDKDIQEISESIKDEQILLEDNNLNPQQK